MRRFLWPLGLAAAWLSPFSAWPQQATVPDVLTLEEAISLAASRSPLIARAQHQLEAQEGAVLQAAVHRNPALSATVEDTRSANRVTTTVLDIPFEMGDKRTARVTVAQRARATAEVELRHVKAELRASVIGAYFATLAAQERAKLALDSSELARRGAQVVDKRVAAGKVSPVDATRAQVDQADAQLEVAEAQAQLVAARHALAMIWGDIEPNFQAVAGDISDVPERPSLDALIAQVDDAPSLLLARTEIEQRLAVVGLERSRAVPDVTVSVGARRDNDLGRTQAVVGVSIPLPLFDRNRGAIYEAAKRVEVARDEYASARLRIMTELQGAAVRLAVSRTSLQALRSAVLPAAQQAYESAAKGFEAGKFGFLDVIDAQRALLRARARYLATLATAHEAAVAIDRLLGR